MVRLSAGLPSSGRASDARQAELLGADLLATAAHDGALDHGGELTHVARPAVAPQLVLGVTRQPPGLPPTLASLAAKYRARGRMSSGRSRSGSKVSVHPANRSRRSARKVPRRTASARSAGVATMTRTSIGLESAPPRRRTRPLSIAASSLPCRSSDSASTSSRNKVPPSAASNRPGVAAVTSGAVPRSYPNSSSSSRDGLDECPRSATAQGVDLPGHHALAGPGLPGEQDRRRCCPPIVHLRQTGQLLSQPARGGGVEDQAWARLRALVEAL
jgi:hypothetical protein